MPEVAALFIGIALPATVWMVDRIASVYVEKKIDNLLHGEERKPYIERIIEKLDSLMVEHQRTTEFLENMINERNSLHSENLYLRRQINEFLRPPSNSSNLVVGHDIANNLPRDNPTS